MLPLRLPKLVVLFVLAGLPCFTAATTLAAFPENNTFQPEPSLSVEPTSPPRRTEPSAPELEATIYELVNQHRQALGLSPLVRDSRLSRLARQHSQEMAERKVRFGHSNFNRRAKQVNRLMRSRRVSENIAYIFSHQETAKRAVQGWLRSDRHRVVLEGKRYEFTGIGVAQGERGAFYFTQLYVQPR